VKATVAPSLANLRTIDAPMPRDPPVTRATLPARGLDIEFLLPIID
jgi:hypothetical protein